MQSYYVDTCIYINLWKKEVDETGKPLWLLAKKFFEFADQNNLKIFYSGFILKEFLFLLSAEEYLNKREFIEYNPLFEKTILTKEEYKEATKLKNKLNTDCSLYDLIHLRLTKKTNSILITQDRELLELANFMDIPAKTPQEIISY